MKDKFSIKNFAIGFLAGAAVVFAVGVVLVYQGTQAIARGSWDDTPIVRDILDVARRSVHEENSVAIYGTLVRMGDTDFEIEANHKGERTTLLFFYDSNTQFVRINNDDDSTESAINPKDLYVGDGITIHAAEPIGSVENQRAVKVFKI